RLGGRECALALNDFAQRLAIDELHGEVNETVVGFTEIVDGGDVRVLDLARVGRFAVEAGDRVGVVDHALVQHFHGAAPAHLHVLGEVHLTHPAFADAPNDVIAIGEDGSHQVAASGRAQRRAIARAEALLEVIGLTALRAGLGGGVHALFGILVGVSGAQRRVYAMRPGRDESTASDRK